jgi:hypothetical protein
MPKYVKLLSGALVAYFFLLGVFGLACLIHFNKDYEQNGGNMGPVYFYVYYCLATAYYSSFLVWSYRLFRGKTTRDPGNARVQLWLIFLLGLGTSLALISLWWMYIA